MGDNLFNTFSFNIWKKHKVDSTLELKNNTKRRREIAKLKRALKEKRLGKTRTVHVKGVSDTKEGLENALEKAVKKAEKAGDKKAAADGARFLERSRMGAEGHSVDVSSEDSDLDDDMFAELRNSGQHQRDHLAPPPGGTGQHQRDHLAPPPGGTGQTDRNGKNKFDSDSDDRQSDSDSDSDSDDVGFIQWKYNAQPGML